MTFTKTIDIDIDAIADTLARHLKNNLEEYDENLTISDAEYVANTPDVYEQIIKEVAKCWLERE